MSDKPQDKATVLIVDDDRVLRRQLFWALEGEHEVIEAETRTEAAAELARGRVDVVLCDLHLPPDLNGITEGLGVVEAAPARRHSWNPNHARMAPRMIMIRRIRPMFCPAS